MFLLLSLTALLACGGGFFVYARLLGQALAGRGRVRSERFGPPEAGVALALTGAFLCLIVGASIQPHAVAAGRGGPLPEPDGPGIVQGILLDTEIKLVLVGVLVAGLVWRGIRPSESFGVDRLGLGAVLGRGGLLLLAALPLTSGTLWLVQRLGAPTESQQEAVRLLRASHDPPSRFAIIFAAVAVAPVVEEFVFRGYLYGVFRRYLGVGPGLLLSSALFAGIHLYPPVLLPLFVLAACLALAYEATGSLLVPMAMHALFNAISICWLVFPR